MLAPSPRPGIFAPAPRRGAQVGSTAVAAYIALALFGATSARAEEVCATVERAIDAEAVSTDDPATLLRLAPHVSAQILPKILQRTRLGNDDLSFAAFIAIGLSRHGEGLKLLREAPAPTTRGGRLGRSLGLLALGDGVDTPTIAHALYSGPLKDRRRVARALARMKQRRPQILLYEAIEDVDDEVRLVAAAPLTRLGLTRPRRVLAELARNPASPVREKAARALRKSGGREDSVPPSPDERLRDLMADAERARKSGLKNLSDRARTQDPIARAAGHAALALIGLDPPGLARVEKVLAPKGAESAGPEALAALALLSDPSAIALLERLPRESTERVIAVFYAFAHAESAALEAEHAGQLARIVETWMTSGALSDGDASRAIRAMSRLDPISGLLLARKRLEGGDGRALRAAVRVIAKTGSLGDVSDLLEAARRFSPATRALSLRAAARACAR